MNPPNGIRLNLGAGTTAIPGFIPVDAKFGHDVRRLPYPADSVDEIYASHVLEHVPLADVLPTLREWVRVLRPQGRLRVSVPNFRYIVDAYQRQDENVPVAEYLMGGQTDCDDFHRSVFDEETLTRFMRQAGLVDVAPFTPTLQDCSSLPVSLNLQGRKALPERLPVPRNLPRISAVMSMPRLAFADNMFCATAVATELGISFEKVTGAFWGQCMERVISPLVTNGTEYILTVDYDTVFGRNEVLRMVEIMQRHPEIDVLAPLQVKRDENTLLFRPVDRDGRDLDQIEADSLDADEVTRVGWAHFGLTLIRAQSLARVPHPWFWDQPDEKGCWGDGRIDADIYFWRKLNKEGLVTCIANHVSVGHLQLMVSWPDQRLRTIHQYVTDYQRYGPPTTARRTV